MIFLPTKAAKALNWLFKQPRDVLLHALSQVRSHFFASKTSEDNKDKTNAELLLQSLIYVAQQLYETEHPTKRKQKDLQTLREAINKRIKRFTLLKKAQKKAKKQKTTKKTKKQRLDELKNEIKMLMDQKLSAKDICEYLAKYHKLQIHYTYIQKYVKHLTEQQ